MRTKNKIKAVFNFIKENKHDVACLQEKNIASEAYDEWKEKRGGDVLYSTSSAHSGGQIVCFVCGFFILFYLFFLVSFPFTIELFIKSTRLRLVQIELDDKNLSILLLNAIAMNSDKKKIVYLVGIVNITTYLFSNNKVQCADFYCMLDNVTGSFRGLNVLLILLVNLLLVHFTAFFMFVIYMMHEVCFTWMNIKMKLVFNNAF